MIIELPFARIRLAHCEPRHRRYFESQFTRTDPIAESRLELVVDFAATPLPPDCVLVEDGIAVDEQAVYVRDTRGRAARLDIGQIGSDAIHFQVDPDFDLYYLYTFLLEPLIIIHLTHRGILVAHASAVVDEQNQAHVFAAWRHTGKTDLLLTLAKRGYGFLADDYCVIHEGTAYLYPKKVNLFSYNFKRYPELYAHLPMGTRWHLRAASRIKRMLEAASRLSRGTLGKVFFRLGQLAEVSTNVKVDPAQLNMKQVVAAPVGTIDLLENSTLQRTTREALSEAEAAEKLARVICYELDEFFQLYRMIVFARPQLKHALIESFAERYEALARGLPGCHRLRLSRDKADVAKHIVGS